MKIVERKGSTFIHPFVTPDGEPSSLTPAVVVDQEGTVKLLWYNSTVMSAEAARTLAQALLHAVEVAEKAKST